MEKEQAVYKCFNWDALIKDILAGTIIPVIGQGLYPVKTNKNNEILLYDYLAEGLASHIGQKVSSTNSKFAYAVVQFLEFQLKNNKKQEVEARMILQDRLIYLLDQISFSQYNPLQKLALIKNFNIFINTTYDDFLLNILTKTRNHSCRSLYYTIRDHGFQHLNDELFERINSSQCTLVYQLLGNFKKNIRPAFTEKEMKKTMISFQKNMEERSGNRLGETLIKNSLLVMGHVGNHQLTDLLVQSLDISGPPIQRDHPKRIFIVYEDADQIIGHDNMELRLFCRARDFVDCLLHRMFEQFPEGLIHLPITMGIHDSYQNWTPPCLRKKENSNDSIISPVTIEDELPKTAFISYDRRNENAAINLASRLQKDGIRVWIATQELKPGDKYEEVTLKEITKCPVFIPIISKKSQSIIKDEEKPKFHFKEWEFACSNNCIGENPEKIMPVIIDDSSPRYKGFKRFHTVRIFNGEAVEGYIKFKKELLKIQKKKQKNAARNQ